MKHIVRIALALALVCIAPLTVHAATVQLKASLAPAKGVTSQARGSVDATLDTASNKFSWHITYEGLTGPATAAHFHGPAAPGENAGPQVPITGAATSPIDGSATITPAQAADLLAGKWYFNVHTKAYGGGEIRGQLTKQ